MNAFEEAVERFLCKIQREAMRPFWVDKEHLELHPELERQVRKRDLIWKARAVAIGVTVFGVTFLIAWVMAAVIRKY